MIINLWGILSIGLIALLGVALKAVFPGPFAEPYADFTYSLLAALVGGATELLGLGGRVLFVIPIWLLGMAMVTYQSYLHWGVLGALAPVAVVGLGIWLMVFVMENLEVKEWAKAVATLPKLRSYPAGASTGQFWKLVEACAFFPKMGSFTPKVCAHNLDVSNIVMDQCAALPDAVDLSPWLAFYEFLKENQTKEKPDALDSDLEMKLKEFVEAKANPGKAA